MGAPLDAESLLAGPRGRRLCWEWLGAPWLMSGEPVEIVRDATRNADPDAVPVMTALSRTVSMAAYWQPPYEEDEILSSPDVGSKLHAVAERLLAHSATQWWGTPLAAGSQCVTQFLDEPAHPTPPTLEVSGDILTSWREKQLRSNEEFRAVREGALPQGMRERDGWAFRALGGTAEARYARMSGTWWSTPDRWLIPVTARDLPGHGPVALSLTEDELDWKSAHCWPVSTTRPVTVYEIGAPQDWADLVSRYPLDITDSRRPDWKQAAGSDGPWLIPDWPAVARDYDAVHVTVLGYLTTAGLPTPVGDGYWSLLAGWDPDATFWLTDALTMSGALSPWVRGDDNEWLRAHL